MLKKIKDFFGSGPFLGIGLLVILVIGMAWMIDGSQVPKVLNHSEFYKAIDEGKINKVKVEKDVVYGKFKDGKPFEASVHMTEKIWDKLTEKNVDVNITSDASSYDGWYIFGLIFLIVIGIIIWILVKKSKNGGGGSVFSFGKSRFKKVSPGEIEVKFENVAGAKNAKEALKDIIDFLKDPSKFKKMGARIPKGVLLAGEPGNGKTLLARAVAGEANCNFLSISGSDFIEVFVGVGASRIRDLFSNARKNTPCILFIDEIDAIGRSRGSGFGGGHDEREQTLNQLLTEMDGFDQFEQPLVILAATNMPEVLDKALLRPGRFDRVVYVPYPDFNARLDLLKIHTKKVPLVENIDLEKIAGYTQGLSGADIENLVNMAALKASQNSREKIEDEDFEKSYKNLLENKRDIQISTSDQTKEFLPQQIKTRFNDIAGLEDAKEDFREVVDFLKNPEKYKEMGARIPKGVLMSGDPGNGKTLLAKAVAGESAVPFFYASGSQFVQKYVGVGAERVRELFTQARKHSPSIIFIDELDSIGKRRQDSEGGNSEYNQTINQLLTEMDGFIENEKPVIVIAATNMKDSIDEALKRPGRFDRHIHVGFPNLKAREKILLIYSKGKKFSADVNIENIARGTPGFSAASLENLLNEAAIIAVSSGKKEIEMKDIEEAKDRIILGKKNEGLIQAKDAILKTAYHEAGHALTSVLQKDYPYTFYKVTILSRGGTLGVSHSLPKDDMTGFSKKALEACIVVAMAGRASEFLMFGEIHTGARGDFKSATDMAFKMINVYGMSEKTGMVYYCDYQNTLSTETKRELDIEIKKILDDCYKKSIEILTENKEKLKKLAEELLEKETLHAEDVYKILEVPFEESKEKIIIKES